MSAQPSRMGEPITSARQLADYLVAGCKPASAWRIGTEHEKLVFRRSDHRPVGYDGPDGIRALLAGMTRFGWQEVREAELPLALTRGSESVTLEPAGQFELSGAPLETLHATSAELDTHLTEARAAADAIGLDFLFLGFEPLARLRDMGRMPKARSDIMRRYMPTAGSLGLDMMHRTATVQVNLDFSSEADMVRKMRVGMALQPIATALFANSPFTEGRPNGFQSYRSHIWTDTDNRRSGILPFVFDADFGFERYVAYMLDVPMYFVFRDGRFIDAAGQAFRDFMDGRLPALPGAVPHIGDWADHLTTAFPEVRLKRFLEMRGADNGSPAMIMALPALWVGLLYDAGALDAATQLIEGWDAAAITALRRTVPREGLGAAIGGRSVLDIARDVLAIAESGLRARARLDAREDETRYLAPLREIADRGYNQAGFWLDRYHRAWHGTIDPLFDEANFR